MAEAQSSLEHSSVVSHEDARQQLASKRVWTGRYERWLLAIFLVSLPFVNPLVHGDGVGYYAYARSILIEHRLDFAPDWKHANESFSSGREDANGKILADEYSETGYLRNHFSIGPAILWLPFLGVTHAGVFIADYLGAHIAADGFSAPYRYTMALATCLYGFLGLWLSFRLARKYLDEKWAFLATIGIWGASSLLVYMYFNPSWSHAQSAFVVALFLWYWDRTRASRTTPQWIVLGLIAGLMMDVYYVNAIVALFPFCESLVRYRRLLVSDRASEAMSLFFGNLCFGVAALLAFLPTLVTKKIIFGSYLNFGYSERWSWNSPAFSKVLFSSDHGLLSWTPVVILAVIGLILFAKRQRNFAVCCLVTFAVYLYVIGSYQDWDGLSSFGNRFFVSLTPIFIIGLASLFDRMARAWKNPRRTFAIAAASTALLILWNFGMMYQWGMHLVPVRGPISWREAVHNQFTVVPSHIAQDVRAYFLRRGRLMQHIENIDVRQLKKRSQ